MKFRGWFSFKCECCLHFLKSFCWAGCCEFLVLELTTLVMHTFFTQTLTEAYLYVNQKEITIYIVVFNKLPNFAS